MSTYSIKELFLTLQGEGAYSGRAAVFCRFTGCNLWTGRDADRKRGKGGCSLWCDTDFVGTDGVAGGQYQGADKLAKAALDTWNEGTAHSQKNPLIVCTGGEPLLQLDKELVTHLHQQGFEIAIETNGTLLPPDGIDWICVSPKAGAPLKLNQGSELKLVYPQEGIDPADYLDLSFEHYFIQPKDGPDKEKDLKLAIAYCLAHPQWRLSLQSHKFIGIA